MKRVAFFASQCSSCVQSRFIFLETLMGNSAATHVATVILKRDISGTAYIFKALHWIKGAVNSDAMQCYKLPGVK